MHLIDSYTVSMKTEKYELCGTVKTPAAQICQCCDAFLFNASASAFLFWCMAFLERYSLRPLVFFLAFGRGWWIVEICWFPLLCGTDRTVALQRLLLSNACVRNAVLQAFRVCFFAYLVVAFGSPTAYFCTHDAEVKFRTRFRIQFLQLQCRRCKYHVYFQGVQFPNEGCELQGSIFAKKRFATTFPQQIVFIYDIMVLRMKFPNSRPSGNEVCKPNLHTLRVSYFQIKNSDV